MHSKHECILDPLSQSNSQMKIVAATLLALALTAHPTSSDVSIQSLNGLDHQIIVDPNHGGVVDVDGAHLRNVESIPEKTRIYDSKDTVDKKTTESSRVLNIIVVLWLLYFAFFNRREISYNTSLHPIVNLKEVAEEEVEEEEEVNEEKVVAAAKSRKKLKSPSKRNGRSKSPSSSKKRTKIVQGGKKFMRTTTLVAGLRDHDKEPVVLRPRPRSPRVSNFDVTYAY